MADMIWSFAPWIAFIALTRLSVYGAAVAGVGVAVIVLVRAIVRHKVHLFDVVGVVFFVIMFAVLLIVHPSDIGTWGRYAQGVAHGTLTLIVLGSVLIRHPFTEAYAREQVPQSVWHSPEFHKFNMQISLVWSLAFIVGTAALFAAGSIHSGQFLLRFVVPYGALALAYLYTQKKAGAAKGQAAAGATAPAEPLS